MRVAVIDTNVIAAALVTADADAPTARILDGMRPGRIPFAISNALLVEYREVLNRPGPSRRHGLDEAEIESLLVALVRHAIVLDPERGPAAPDPCDQHPWDLLASHDQLCLLISDESQLFPIVIPGPAPDSSAPEPGIQLFGEEQKAGFRVLSAKSADSPGMTML